MPPRNGPVASLTPLSKVVDAQPLIAVYPGYGGIAPSSKLGFVRVGVVATPRELTRTWSISVVRSPPRGLVAWRVSTAEMSVATKVAVVRSWKLV